MMKVTFAAAFTLGLVACAPPADREAERKSIHEIARDVTVEQIATERGLTPQDAEAVLDADMALQREIDALRQADPAVNWVNIGITTGKFSESIGSNVYRTYEECLKNSWMQDNECFPIPALPQSYWDAEKVAAQAIETRRAETERLGAQHESAVAESHAPEPSASIQAKQGE